MERGSLERVDLQIGSEIPCKFIFGMAISQNTDDLYAMNKAAGGQYFINEVILKKNIYTISLACNWSK